ncbi:hypothetical protein ERJ75_001144700 [Trypanosoma vivax]|nr:hypothetical protein ERJ75_001144700 [Trypanosoma vivax]
MRTTGEPTETGGQVWRGALTVRAVHSGRATNAKSGVARQTTNPAPQATREEQRRHARGGSSAATGQPVCMALGGTQTGVSRHPRSAAVEHFDPWARNGKNRKTGHLRTQRAQARRCQEEVRRAWPDGPADANSKRRRMSALRAQPRCHKCLQEWWRRLCRRAGVTAAGVRWQGGCSVGERRRSGEDGGHGRRDASMNREKGRARAASGDAWKEAD